MGTPKGRLSKLEQGVLGQPWAKVRDGVQVKRLATEEDIYVLARAASGPFVAARADELGAG